MSLLSTLSTSEDIGNEKDSVGGSNVLDTAIYKFTINSAYVSKSAGGAMGLIVSLKTDDDKEMRQTLWMTSGDAKGNKNYYEDKTGQKQYLPGFNLANSLALLACGKEISTLTTEQKVIKAWSFEAKAEIPTKVDMLMDLVGKEIYGAVFRQVVDKTAKNDAGAYVPTGETREENELDKIFRVKDKMTTAEIRAQADEATFFDTWDAKWSGKTRDKSTKGAAGVAGAPSGAAKAGAGASGTKKPTTSLFG